MAPDPSLPGLDSLPSLDEVRSAVGTELLDAHHARGRTGGSQTRHGGLFGGQMIAQALSACAHTVPPDAVPDSIHACLLARGHSGDDVDFRVEAVRDGRALQHREVRGYQGDELVIEALVVSTVPAEGLDWQRSPTPVAAPPDTSPSAPAGWGDGLGRGMFDVAHPSAVDEAPRRAHPIWVRSALALPDEPWLHGAVRAYWSDFGMNWSARVAHHELDDEQVASLSATHTLTFHRWSPLTIWHLLDVHTESLVGNQAFVNATLHDATGALTASISQRVFVRRPRPN